MRNQYPGQCYVCNTLVQKGAGHFERNYGEWLVRHATCPSNLKEMQKQNVANPKP